MGSQEAFLRQEVESASPAKLRFLLLQKAHGLSLVVQDLWRQGKHEEAQQWVLRIQDIITELLSGVVDPTHELARVTSDLYIFMSKLIASVSVERDLEALLNISEILEIELETWSMFVRKEMLEANPSHGASYGSAFVPAGDCTENTGAFSIQA